MDKLLYVIAAVHAGMGFAHFVYAYYGMGIAFYGGSSGWLYFTPLQDFVSIEAGGGPSISLLNFGGLFRLVTDLGDTINTLLWFDYELLEMVPEATFGYWIVMGFWVASWGLTLKLGFEVFKLIISSGIMQSTLGLSLVLGGAGVTGALGLAGGLT